MTELANARMHPLSLLVSAECIPSPFPSLSGVRAQMNVTIAKNSQSGAAVYVRCEIRDTAAAVIPQSGGPPDDRVLPIFSDDGFFSLLPSEERSLIIQAPNAAMSPTLRIACEAWNAPVVVVACT